MASNRLHTDRARAESFGAAAAEYDRRRPSPPGSLIDDLATLRPARVLDVGCGTGKAAVSLAERGLSVLGVEPDERMAAVARGHGIDVEVATFEAWHDAGRQFDLLTVADSWQWIDPTAGIVKAARVLRPGGTFARFWNGGVLDPPVIEALDAVYREYAPEVAQMWRPVADRARVHGVAESDAERLSNAGFHSVTTRTYSSDSSVSAEDWVAGAATISDHRRLGPDRLAPLLRELQAAIERLGGAVRVHTETFLVLARRA